MFRTVATSILLTIALCLAFPRLASAAARCRACTRPRLASAARFGADNEALVAFPAAGAKLGQGVNIYLETPAPGLCIDLTKLNENNDAKPPQDVEVKLREMHDASRYMESSTVSASLAADYILGKANAKLEYIHNHEYSDTNSIIMVHGEAVQHSQLEIAGGKGKARGIPEFALSGDAKKLLRTFPWQRPNYARFRATCGDGFIIDIEKGKELNATMTIHGHESSNVASLKAGLTVTMGTASLNSSLQQTLTQAYVAGSTSFDYQARGGSGDAVALSMEQAITEIGNLRSAASIAPENFKAIVVAYRSLPDWPKGDENALRTSGALNNANAIYWRIDAAIQQAKDVLADMAAGRLNKYLPLNLSYDDVVTTYTKMVKLRQQARDHIQECFRSEQACESQEEMMEAEHYALAARLPILMAHEGLGVSRLQTEEYRLASAARAFKERKLWYWGTFDQRLGPFVVDPTCTLHANAIATSMHNNGDVVNLDAAIDQFKGYIAAAALSDVADDSYRTYVEGPIIQDCSLDTADVDCKLSNSDTLATIRRSRILQAPTLQLFTNNERGEVSSPYAKKIEFDNALYSQGPCPPGNSTAWPAPAFRYMVQVGKQTFSWNLPN